MEAALRPMSTSQVLDRTFSLYRSNFALFAGIAMVAPALTLISRLMQLWIFGSPFLGQARISPKLAAALIIRTLIGYMIGFVIYLVGNALASAATVYAVSMVHLGQPAFIAECYARIKPVFFRVLLLIAAVFLIAMWPLLLSYAVLLVFAFNVNSLPKDDTTLVIVGIGVLIVFAVGLVGGGFWALRAFCRYALSVAACTLERLPFRPSLVRSKFLTKASLMRVFVIYLLTIVMGFVLTYVLQSPALIASKALLLTARSHVSLAALLWIYIAEFLGGTLAGPIATIAMALLYYDERVRKEAFDLQLMMQTITPQNAAQAAPAAGAL